MPTPHISRPARLAAAFALVVAALLTPSAARADWITPADSFPSGGLFVADEDITVDATGTVVAAWQSDEGVRAVVKAPGEPFGAPVTLTDSNSAGTPAVALDGRGNALVAYQEGGKVVVAQRPPGGDFTRLPGLGAAVEAPAVGFTADGTAIVAWLENDRIEAAVRAPGAGFVPTGQLNPAGEPANEPRVTTHPASGHAAVAWTSKESGPPITVRARAAYRPAGGAFAPAESIYTRSFAAAITNASGGYLTGRMNAAGEVEVAWSDGYYDGADWNGFIRASRRGAGAGGTWASPKLLDSAVDTPIAGQYVYSPNISASDDGAAVVTWTWSDYVIDDRQIRAAAHPAGSPNYSPLTPVASSFELADAVDSARSEGLADGQTIAMFNRGNEVFSSLRAPGGSFGSPFTVSAGTAIGALSIGSTATVDAAALVARGPDISVLRLDRTAPELRELAVPAATQAGSPVAMSVTPFDALSSAAAPVWDFGDGSTSSGASPTHTYAAPGTYTVKVSTIDGGGNAASRTATISVSPLPDEVDRRAPTVSAFGLSTRTFGASASGARATRRIRRGTTFRFTLSEPARAVIRLERVLRGVRVGRACRAPKKGRRGRRCVRYRAAGRISRAAKAGRNSLRFSGRLRRRALPAARYRATLIATDAAGNRSAARRASFKIVR